MTAGFRVSLICLLLALPGLVGGVPLDPKPRSIGTLGGTVPGTYGIAISAAGHVVGSSSLPSGNGHAFLWTKAQGIRDLGTLGGPGSNAQDVNAAGVVVGFSDLPNDRQHAFRWTAAQGMKDLTPGAQFSMAAAINTSGLVAGAVERLNDPDIEAFLWSPQQGLQRLGNFQGVTTWPVDLNDAGEMTGNYWHPEGVRGFYWSVGTGFVDLGAGTVPVAINAGGTVVGNIRDAFGSTSRAFVWTFPGGLVELGTLGGTNSTAFSINNLGLVVGMSGTEENLRTTGFRWTASGGMVELPTLGGSSCDPAAIAPNADVIVGASAVAPGITHAFRWTSEAGMVDLGALEGDFSSAHLVNDAGLVVGASSIGSFQSGVTWDAEGIRAMESLGGKMSEADALSQAGHIVGTSFTPGGRLNAFRWTAAEGMIGLGDLGWPESRPVAVNASGHVAGNSRISAEQERAFFWRPGLGMVDLGDFGGAAVVVAGMNASSVVLVQLNYPDQVWGARWEQGGATQILLPLPGSMYCVASAIDAQGRVVGNSFDENGRIVPVFWAPGQTIPELLFDPDALGAYEIHVFRLSDSGWTAGVASLDPENPTLRGWVRDPQGNVRILQNLGGGGELVVRGMNEAGDLCGSILTEAFGHVPAVWLAGELTASGERSLRLIAGSDRFGQAHAINASRKVAGILEEDGGFVWSLPQGLKVQGTLGGRTAYFATINDAGQIAGSADLPDGSTRAFIVD